MNQNIYEEAQQILERLNEDLKPIMSDAGVVTRIATTFSKLEEISKVVGIRILPHLETLYSDFETKHNAWVLFAISAPNVENLTGDLAQDYIKLQHVRVSGIALVVFLNESKPAKDAGKDAKAITVIAVGQVKPLLTALFKNPKVADDDYLSITTTCEDITEADKERTSEVVSDLADRLEKIVNAVLAEYGTPEPNGLAIN